MTFPAAMNPPDDGDLADADERLRGRAATNRTAAVVSAALSTRR
jgi:hypothetical protein